MLLSKGIGGERSHDNNLQLLHEVLRVLELFFTQEGLGMGSC
jgi:hypothetical protein